jgi:hypothetical protein
MPHFSPLRVTEESPFCAIEPQISMKYWTTADLFGFAIILLHSRQLAMGRVLPKSIIIRT